MRLTTKGQPKTNPLTNTHLGVPHLIHHRVVSLLLLLRCCLLLHQLHQSSICCGHCCLEFCSSGHHTVLPTPLPCPPLLSWLQVPEDGHGPAYLRPRDVALRGGYCYDSFRTHAELHPTPVFHREHDVLRHMTSLIVHTCMHTPITRGPRKFVGVSCLLCSMASCIKSPQSSGK